MAIVIPAYKGRFLKETLDSIAVQAHKDEFVLYIGDDASPERLDKIVESYQNKVNLVYHRFSENMGGKDLVAHWERCIQLSAEPFIWLFSDDDLMPRLMVWNVSWRLCRAHTISEDISFVFH
ncbi:glycosyltransferase [Phocaeicola dorei]|nr:glycosyltransferase [Phocaeicola dorei]